MKKTISSQGFKLAILGAALAVSGAVMAGDAGPQRFHDRAGHPQVGHHHVHQGFHKVHPHAFHHGKGMQRHRQDHAQRAGLIVPGYGVVSRDFVEGMGLNGEQLKLIDEARKAAGELRDSRTERMKAQRESRRELFNADFDPEQALKQADENRAQMLAERRKIDDKWVAVWKSLDAGQQARVADHLKQRAEKAEKRAEKMQERKKQREARNASRAAPAVSS